MRFEQSDDQRMIQESVRRFVETEVGPNAGAWDEAEAIPRSALDGLAQLGIMGMFVEPDLSGAGLDLVAGTIAIEEIARHSGSLALVVAAHNTLAIEHIHRAGTADQRARWLPSLAKGERIAAWALIEPSSRFDALATLDASHVQTTAKRSGDRWVIEGKKRSVIDGALADLCVVIARIEERDAPKEAGQEAGTGPGRESTAELAAFVLERAMTGYVSRARHRELGLRAAEIADLELVAVEVPEDHRLGSGSGSGSAEGGLLDVLEVLGRSKVALAAVSLGIARGALEEARRYALERKQFGKPIAEFQAIQWMLADVATELDAARLMVRRAAVLADRRKPLLPQAEEAKLFASRVAVDAAMKAIQIHGGYGFVRDFPVERYLRDAKSLEVEPGHGTLDVQRMAIARSLLGR